MHFCKDISKEIRCQYVILFATFFYETYTDMKVIAVGTHNVIVNGEGDTVYLATWTDGTNAYSIYTEQGVTQKQLEDMLE